MALVTRAIRATFTEYLSTFPDMSCSGVQVFACYKLLITKEKPLTLDVSFSEWLKYSVNLDGAICSRMQTKRFALACVAASP